MPIKKSDLLETINQLESLRQHCFEYVDVYDPECVWKKDCDALSFAISCLIYIDKCESFVDYCEKNNIKEFDF